MGAIFFHSNPSQEDMIFKGLKYMLVNKKTVIGERGEQSLEVHQVLVERISEMLIHNQKVIINAAVREAEEKMRIHLIRQIQDLRGRKSGSEYISPELKRSVRQVVHEKFPLRAPIREHLEDMLEFYTETSFPEVRSYALKEKMRLEEIRKPLTLTGEGKSR